MRKKIVRVVPFSPNVNKVIYEDGTFGLQGVQGSVNDEPTPEIIDEPLYHSEEIDEDPMRSKYLTILGR